MDDRGLQSPRAVGRCLSSSCRAEPSEDAEIFDSDGLPSLSKILARSKQVIDLTLNDDGDGERRQRGYYRGKLAQKVLDGSTSCEANSTVVDRPLPDCRPTPFSPHCPRCRNRPHTALTTLQRRLQRPHLAVGRMSLRGCHFTANFNSIRPPLFRG